jgi:heme-degrading monooxygenase HmoA
MYSAAFIFKPGTYDNEFHRLNGLIDAAAKANPGFISSETWKSANGESVNATYYWKTLQDLQKFSQHPKHLEAKKQYRRWYNGYHIIISEVLRSYGDETIDHCTPNDRATRR